MCLCVLHDLASCLWVYFRTLCLACRARPCGCGCVSCALVTCIMCAGYVYHVSWLRVSCALVTLDTMHALCGVCLGLARNHTFIGVYGVYTVFLAGESPYIWSYMVQIYGSGQPYVCHVQQSSACCWVCRVCVGTFVCLCMYHLTLGITVLHSFDISACL